jgi:hypothetical protein
MPQTETPIPTGERPVFVSDDGRRARRLALATRAAAALVATWAVALAAGGVGFAPLPALHPVAAARPGAAPVASRALARNTRVRGRTRVALRLSARDTDARVACPAVRGGARTRSHSCRPVAV